jgi:hypothetical protein
MVYRKSPPRPPRLLLRVVAAAGAGALLGATACSSNSPIEGSLPAVPNDSGADHSAGGGVAPCADGGCGIVVSPEGGDAEMVGGGVMVSPEAGIDANPPGVAPFPDSGTD